MVVFVMTNVSESIRGALTRWVMEVKAGVFVGNINKTVRDSLWDKLKKENVSNALMIYNFNNEQGFNIEMLGEPYRYVKDYEGILLVSKKIEGSTI